jgi:peptidoglycan/LPS O-acetylase OafA/YrhL
MGLSTYPLYLIHNPIGGAVMGPALHAGMPAWPATMSGLIASIAVSLLICQLGEPWVRKALLGALDRGAALAKEQMGAQTFLFRATERLVPIAEGISPKSFSGVESR